MMTRRESGRYRVCLYTDMFTMKVPYHKVHKQWNDVLRFRPEVVQNSKNFPVCSSSQKLRLARARLMPCRISFSFLKELIHMKFVSLVALHFPSDQSSFFERQRASAVEIREYTHVFVFVTHLTCRLAGLILTKPWVVTRDALLRTCDNEIWFFFSKKTNEKDQWWPVSRTYFFQFHVPFNLIILFDLLVMQSRSKVAIKRTPKDQLQTEESPISLSRIFWEFLRTEALSANEYSRLVSFRMHAFAGAWLRIFNNEHCPSKKTNVTSALETRINKDKRKLKHIDCAFPIVDRSWE